MKKSISRFYEVLFNYFLKKDGGYSSATPILVSSIIGLTLFLFITTINCAISLVIGSPFFNHLGINKGLIWICLAIYMAVVYLILFSAFKITKHGKEEDNYLFKLEEKTIKLVWKLFIINMALCFIVMFLYAIYVPTKATINEHSFLIPLR
ncbi:hypothetical protein GM921_13610 [Pedobacter sp. LMG 31464]|uniref:Uncharacterized protein n=1 Tax=Pedobacter planticolens TaxID=2679964 RepID=A0A923IWV1_9SPHI|nr:hypothetical protein [Pedobacter planticolens]MBB2146534.1 hypothetical protein [Pedobacter planticolens]